jgi:hypothetical protein
MISFGRKKLKLVTEDNNNDYHDVKDVESRFYDVGEHEEVFRIGKSYYGDILNGQKCFAISSLGYKTSQQRCILGIASYLDMENDIKVRIISDNIYQGVFKEIVEAGTTSCELLENTNLKIDIHKFHHHFEVIDMNDLIEFGEEHPTLYKKMIKQVIGNGEVVLFDVPSLNKMKENFRLYLPIISEFESLSVVVVKHSTDQKQLQELYQFFGSHGVSLKGVFMQDVAQVKKAV